jgi:hypothetical protein
MKRWHIKGRYIADPPPSDWRELLATRLGQRPRRASPWVELALFGAVQCIDAAGEKKLSNSALLSLCSIHGPYIALRTALVQAREDALLPIAFLSSQPSQVLPVLAQHLGWSGNGRGMATRDPALALRMAALEAGDAGMLIGWVEENGPGKSIWLRLTQTTRETPLQAATFAELANTQFTQLAFVDAQLHLG